MSESRFKRVDAQRSHVASHRVKRGLQVWGTLNDIRDALLGTLLREATTASFDRSPREVGPGGRSPVHQGDSTRV